MNSNANSTAQQEELKVQDSIGQYLNEYLNPDYIIADYLDQEVSKIKQVCSKPSEELLHTNFQLKSQSPKKEYISDFPQNFVGTQDFSGVQKQNGAQNFTGTQNQQGEQKYFSPFQAFGAANDTSQVVQNDQFNQINYLTKDFKQEAIQYKDTFQVIEPYMESSWSRQYSQTAFKLVQSTDILPESESFQNSQKQADKILQKKRGNNSRLPYRNKKKSKECLDNEQFLGQENSFDLSDSIYSRGNSDIKGFKQRRKRHRNILQQQQNKLAQQRYRERRKQQVQEMQGLVDELQNQLDKSNSDRQRLQAQKAERGQRIKELEANVQQRQKGDFTKIHMKQQSYGPEDIKIQKLQLKIQIQSIVDLANKNQGINLCQNQQQGAFRECIANFVQVQVNVLKCLQRLQTFKKEFKQEDTCKFYLQNPDLQPIEEFFKQEDNSFVDTQKLSQTFYDKFKYPVLSVQKFIDLKESLMKKLTKVYQDRVNLYVQVGQGMFNQMLSTPSVNEKIEYLNDYGLMLCQKNWIEVKSLLQIQDNLNSEYIFYSEFCMPLLEEILTFDQAIFLMNTIGDRAVDLMHFCTLLINIIQQS